MPDQPSGADERSFFGRLRDAFGNSPVEGRKNGIAGFRPAPGPFDAPPPEPIELDGEVPWELRDDESDGIRS